MENNEHMTRSQMFIKRPKLLRNVLAKNMKETRTARKQIAFETRENEPS